MRINVFSYAWASQHENRLSNSLPNQAWLPYVPIPSDNRLTRQIPESPDGMESSTPNNWNPNTKYHFKIPRNSKNEVEKVTSARFSRDGDKLVTAGTDVLINVQ